VVIDRERGQTRPVDISLKQRGKALADIWVQGWLILHPGERSELLAFLAGYFAESGIYRLNKAMREILVDWVLRCATDILVSDYRFALLRHYFKEKYGIPQE